MTNKIGGIVIDVDARVTKLEASLAKSERRFNQFEKRTNATGRNVEKSVGRIDRSFGTLKTGLVGLAAGVSVRALTDLGRFSLQFADDLGTAADRANINVERFQTLKEVFRVLEVDAASFDKALGRLNGTLGDVQRGVQDEATKSLDAMGISTRIVNGQITTTDQLLDAIAASSKTFGTEAEFTSAVIDIFGQRLGNQLAPALSKGTEALREAEQAVRDAGMVVDEFSVKQLADANEAVDRFSSQTQIKFVNWSATVIEQIYKVGDAWRDFQNNGLFTVRRGPQDSLESEINQMFGFTNRENFFRSVREGAASSGGPASPLSSGGSGSTGGGRSRPSRSRSSGRAGGGLSDEQKATKEFEKQRLENERILEIQTLRHKGGNLEADIQQKIWQVEGGIAKLSAGQLEILKQQNAQILIQAERYNEISNVIESWQQIEITGPGQQSVTDQLDRLVDKNLQSAGLIEATNVRIAKSFKDTAQETLSAIDRMTNAVQGGGFLDILSAVINLGLQLGSIGAFGSDVATSINSFKGYAKGTPFAPGGLAVVGEQGPELVNLPRGSQVIPNNRLRGAGPTVGGSVVQIVPSPYFKAIVQQIAAEQAAPMAVQGAVAGANLAQTRAVKSQKNQLR